MRKRLETWAAAAGMAEGGDFDSACELLEELRELEKNGKPKILVVGNDDSITSDTALYLSNLAKRISSEIILVSSSTSRKDKADLPEGIRTLEQLMGSGLRLTYLPALGQVEQIVRLIVKKARRLEFAVLIGGGNQSLRKVLKKPVFSL